MKHLDTFSMFEESVRGLTNQMAADFIGLTLSNADSLIRESGRRKESYTVQRSRKRTLISSVGDITFTHTLYKDQEGRCRCLLDELIRLPDRERFTPSAEAKVLNEAEVHSYQHAAEAIKINGQTITKTTVMNKVHSIEKELPEMKEPPKKKKACEYLYIEADEDHIHRQKCEKEQGCFIGKLVYLFEGKEEVCKGRRKLISPFYFGGLYGGSDQNAVLWEKVDAYIQEHYDQDVLKCVYINSDGGSWVRASENYVGKSRLVADRFHLMKYINRVARCTEDKENITKGRFYKYIYKNKLLAAKKLLTRILNRYEWSETVSDRMCRLRCFIRNYGREKVIDLVNYRREPEMVNAVSTGTDGMIDEPQRKRYTAKQRESQRYAEVLHGTLSRNSTVRKIFAIREQLGNI
ncbi:UPF0236 family protein [Mediterraneibacter glycyrrhizinilyticus]|nr:UPF0236 family protein [Mediterraneibacter glycyrrhizinilyticus]MBM6853500.1 UPF0236 family protein [Mediterraneibacter glycyrrhizinilyticus]